MTTSAPALRAPNLWLRDPRWDLTFLIGSAVLAAVPLSLFYIFGVSTTVINFLVAGLIGGPHLYSTYGFTVVEPGFRRTYGWLLLPCILLPLGVGWLAANNMTLLLTIFFFWASVHVLHQIAYITDAYRHKDPRPRSAWNRAIDYGLIFTGLYPLASAKLIRGEFVVGGDRPLLVPEFARKEWIPYAVIALFLTFLVLYVVKTIREHREGRLNLPSVVLISVTTAVSLAIPTFSNLDVSFQGYNTWHSFQYLALVWYINSLRKENGEITNRWVSAVSGAGRHWAFYGMNLALTGAAFALIMLLYHVLGLDWAQSYYSVVLGSLLVHYYLDHFNFFRFGAVVREPSPAALAERSLSPAAV
jgi:hypothetical protein